MEENGWKRSWVGKGERKMGWQGGGGMNGKEVWVGKGDRRMDEK